MCYSKKFFNYQESKQLGPLCDLLPLCPMEPHLRVRMGRHQPSGVVTALACSAGNLEMPAPPCSSQPFLRAPVACLPSALKLGPMPTMCHLPSLYPGF